MKLQDLERRIDKYDAELKALLVEQRNIEVAIHLARLKRHEIWIKVRELRKEA